MNYIEIMGFIDEGFDKNIFPLQTIQSMAERWGVKANVVSNWLARHDDFPKPINIITATDRTPTIYPLFEVERYERARRLQG